MEKNQKQIMKVLKDMGYIPEIDADGDICIYLEMKHFYFFVAETEDTKYVNLVLPQFAPIEEGQEVLALATCNLITRDMKIVKTYIERTHDSISASCEFIYPDEESLKQNITTCLEVMRVIKTLYRRKYKELSK